MNCRHCQSVLWHGFLDLGFAPPSNAYLNAGDLSKPEIYYPLKLMVCDDCWLVQTEDYARADELFRDDYAYFSSVSTTWLAHAARYTSMVMERFQLTRKSHVIEVACNDGYLLKNFLSSSIPCLGIEPTASTAAAAENLGIPVLREFFGQDLGMRLATEGKRADLIVGNNVYAHVPDINNFTAGLEAALKPEGVVTLEFPHLLELLAYTQFDTVYHEHFSYLSLFTVNRVFDEHGLRVFDVEQLPTHGGSLRVFGCHKSDNRSTTAAVAEVLNAESKAGMRDLNTYVQFQQRADNVKNNLLRFLIEQKVAGKKVLAYGAAAKGNTLLNYAGVKPDLLPAVVDAAPSKQGKFLPGSHIPILAPGHLKETNPEYVLILPWNIADEVMKQQSEINEWGGKFVRAIPNLAIL